MGVQSGIQDVQKSPLPLIKIRGAYPRLKKSEKKIADYILSNPDRILTLTVTELAVLTDTSEATVVRLCQHVGFKGFQELKILMEREFVSPPQTIHEELSPEDDLVTLKQKIFNANMGALKDTLDVLSDDELEKAVKAIAGARRVEFYGMGASGTVALDAQHKFLKIGIWVAAFIDCNLQAMSASLLTDADVAVGISHTGSNKDTIEAVKIAKEAGATTICITNHAKSPITKVSDIKLYTASRETAFRSDATASRIAQLTIIDVLYAGVSLARYSESLENINKTRRATVMKRW